MRQEIWEQCKNITVLTGDYLTYGTPNSEEKYLQKLDDNLEWALVNCAKKL